MAVLCGMPTIQYLTWSALYLCTSCLLPAFVHWSAVIAELWWPEVTRCLRNWEIFAFFFCSHCRVMVAWSHKMFEKLRNFCVFFKTTPCSKIFDRRVVFQFREIWPMGNQWNRVLLTWRKEKISLGSPAVATVRIAPKICQRKPLTKYSSAPDFI